MSFKANQRIKVFETGELVGVGSIQVPQAQQLYYVRIRLYKHGLAGGDERLRVRFFHDPALTKPYATSEWSRLADIEDLGTYWFGWFRFDFAGQWLGPMSTFYMAVETDNYTRHADDFYLGGALDDGFGIYGEPHALAMEIYGEREGPIT